MMPNITRGSNPKGLLRYLFGKGRHNEHRDQHLVGASRDMQEGFGCEVVRGSGGHVRPSVP